jgi:predicted Zn-dependent protease
MWSLFVIHAAQAQELVLADAHHPRWEPRGRALEPYGRGESKRRIEAWAEAITLQQEALDAQPGCGACLTSLSTSLVGAGRLEEALRVSEHLTRTWPGRSEGPATTAKAHEKARDYASAAEATTRYLELEPEDPTAWHERHTQLLRLGRSAEAADLLASAPASLGEPFVACLEVETALAEGRLDDARLAYPTCDEGHEVQLERQVEGWLLLQEGQRRDAQARLAQGGAEQETRLALAQVRLEEGATDPGINLTTRLLQEVPWAIDVQLAHALALVADGDAAGALRTLDAMLAVDPTEWTRSDVLLFLASPNRANEVATEARALRERLVGAAVVTAE